MKQPSINIKLFIFLTCIAWVYISCENNQLNEGQVIKLKFEYDDIEFSDMIDTIMYIPLQTNAESLIGQISHLFYRQNKYYVFDRQQQKIVVFDETGKYITKLDHNGQGPCEYETIYDMYVDKHGIVKILSQSNPIKIIYYSVENQSCNEVLWDELAGDKFYPYADGYVFFSPNGDERPTHQFFLFQTNSKGEIENKWLPSHSYVDYSLSVNAFSAYRDTLLFNKHFDNHIYQILPNKEISIRYNLDFGKHQIPENQKELFQEKFRYYLESSEDYIIKLDFFYETSNLLVFSYATQQGDSPFLGVFDKNMNVLNVLDSKDDLSMAMSTPINLLEEDYFISCLDVSEVLFDKTQAYEAYREQLFQKYPGLESAVSALSETSNPILIKYKFKSR